MTTLQQIEQEIHNTLTAMKMVDIDDSEQINELTIILEALLIEMNQKIDEYLYIIRHFEQQAEIQSKEASRLQSLANESSQKAQYMKEVLKNHMEMTETKKILGTFGKVSLCKNGGKSPMWIDSGIDIDELPDEFIITTKTVDACKIREYCEQHGELKVGDRSIAQILERQTHLRIR